MPWEARGKNHTCIPEQAIHSRVGPNDPLGPFPPRIFCDSVMEVATSVVEEWLWWHFTVCLVALWFISSCYWGTFSL